VPRIAILFDNFGPYHLARLRAASTACDVLAVEFGSSSAEYDWKASEAAGLKRVVLNPKGGSHQMSKEEFRLRLDKILNDFHPDAVVVPGWGYHGALLALSWSLSHRVPAVVMSESTAWDAERNPIKEWVKSRIVSLFSSALVGGSPHRAYMEQLGLPEERIFLGYDAVDNRCFEEAAREIGSRRLEMGETKKPFFLASARFIVKKNLFRLLRAYALYRREANNAVEGRVSRAKSPGGDAADCRRQPQRGGTARGQRVPSIEGTDSDTSTFSLQPSAFDLVLLGDGELRPELEKLRSELGLEPCVLMPGFTQYEELPGYYAAAGAFIHASTTEQWGLVVNEAMASGLPVLVSNRCGCAADLVQDGVNGWTFDPTNEEQIAELMMRISSDEDGRLKMGARSREIIAEWGPDRFASGLKSAVDAALKAPRRRAGILNRLILLAMTRR